MKKRFISKRRSLIAACVLICISPAWADNTMLGTGAAAGAMMAIGDDNTAVGDGAQANTAVLEGGVLGRYAGDGATAIGAGATATNTPFLTGDPLSPISPQAASTAIGSNAVATDGGTAIGGTNLLGTGAVAGANAVAVGSSSTATGGQSIAIQGNATTFGAVAIGTGATATGGAILDPSAVAIGAGATAVGTGTTAIGVSATSTHAGSVALGSGTVTTRTDEVAIGGRLLGGVNDGVLATDAVNRGQLDSVATIANSALSSAVQAHARIDGQEVRIAGAEASLVSHNLRINQSQRDATAALTGDAWDSVARAEARRAHSRIDVNVEQIALHATQLTEHSTRIDAAQRDATAALTGDAWDDIARKGLDAANVRIDANTSTLNVHDNRITKTEVTLSEHSDELHAHAGAITDLNAGQADLGRRAAALEGEVKRLDKKSDSIMAMAMAATSVQSESLAPGEAALGVGVGTFRGQGALAVGVMKSLKSGGLLSFRLAGSSLGAAAGVGFSMKF